jgi:hypothetical protein
MRKTARRYCRRAISNEGLYLAGLSCPGLRTRGFPCPFQPVIKRRVDDLGVGRQIEVDWRIGAVKGEYAGCPGGEIG